MHVRRNLNIFAASLFLGLLAGTAQATVYNYVQQGNTSYSDTDQGPYSNGSFSGELYQTQTTSYSSSYLTPPATPLPVELPNYSSTLWYVISGGEPIGGPFTGDFSDGVGDNLYVSGVTDSWIGDVITLSFNFTGDTGVYAGVSGGGTDVVTYNSTTQTNSFISTDSLVVPEPASISIAGLGLLALFAPRRKA